MDKYILNRDDVLLLIIDIQERLAPAVKKSDKAIKNTSVLVEAAYEMDFPIIVTEQYPKGLGETVGELAKARREDNVYSKISYDAYVDDIKEAIDKENKKQIIIAGMETHICVYQTARSLSMAGYQVHIARDAVSSRDKKNYLNGLDLIEKTGGVVSNTETIVFDLLKTAGTEEFKKMSKLIK